MPDRVRLLYDEAGFLVDLKGDLYCRPFSNKVARLTDQQRYSIAEEDDEGLWIIKDDGSMPYKLTD